MNFTKTLLSFKFAIQGIKWLFKNENNARFHLLATILVIGMGLWFRLSATEWSLIVLCIGLVLSAEAFNSAIENLCDYVSPEQKIIIGIVKDLSAGAVLILAIVSVIVACFIFIPKF